MTDDKQLKNVEYFNYLGSMIINYGRCALHNKSRNTMAQVAFNKKKNFFHQQMYLNLRKKLVKTFGV
jgi:hypothetical protein